MPDANKDEDFAVIFERFPNDVTRVLPEEIALIEAHLPELLKLAVMFTDPPKERD